MPACDIGLRTATIILVAICAMWIAAFAAEAIGIPGGPALAIGALAAFAASDVYARITERGVPRPHRLLGPQR
jgi:hypothetical protein